MSHIQENLSSVILSSLDLFARIGGVDPLKPLKDRVKQARLAASFKSQDGLSKRIKELGGRLSKTTISNIESGKHSPKHSTLVWIARGCKLPDDFFDTLSGDASEKEIYRKFEFLLNSPARDWIVEAVTDKYETTLKSGLIQPEEKKKINTN